MLTTVTNRCETPFDYWIIVIAQSNNTRSDAPRWVHQRLTTCTPLRQRSQRSCAYNVIVSVTCIRVIGMFARGPYVWCACKEGNPKFCPEVMGLSSSMSLNFQCHAITTFWSICAWISPNSSWPCSKKQSNIRESIFFSVPSLHNDAFKAHNCPFLGAYIVVC